MEIGKIYRQSNSLSCIIPKAVVKALGLKAGDHITWEVVDGKAVIRKLER